MSVSVFSCVLSALFGTAFILAIHFLRGRTFFLQSFGVHAVLCLYGLCLLRMAVPFEMPFAVPVGQGVFSGVLVSIRDTRVAFGRFQLALPDLLCGLWLTVAAVLLMRFLWRDFRVQKDLKRYKKNRSPAAERVLGAIKQTSRKALSTRVCVCPDIDVPMGAGLLDKCIYLPDEEYSEKELYYILKHEYTHFCNRDLLTKLLVRVLCCIFWWNPAVYLLKSDVDQILEVKCDMKAARGFTKQERLEYLMTIVRLLDGEPPGHSPPEMLATGLLKDQDGIKERFLLLTRPPARAPKWMWGLLWVCTAAVVALSYSFVLQPTNRAGAGPRADVFQMSQETANLLISGVLWLFVLTQVKYQLFRNKGRSILALSAAALLCGAMAFYMGNIQSTQNAIDALADTIPVKVNVVNRTGEKRRELFIEPQMFDGLSDAGVKDMLATAEAVGAWSDGAKNQEPFFGGDVDMAAINDVRCWEDFDDGKMEWLAGTASSVFGTDQPVCALTEQCAERFGVGLGGEAGVAVYAVRRSPSGITYELVEDAAFQVAGIYHNGDSTVGKEMYITTAWMRAAAERKGASFSYDSAMCRLEDPRQLNSFKKELPRLGFMEPFDGADNKFRGDAVTVDDELFIKTSRNLKRNLETFQNFLVPFYLLVISLVTMMTFLMLRGSRRDMAIASSLGQPRWQTAFSNFSSTVLAYLVGCAVMVPETMLLARISLIEGLAVCGIFLLCAALGVATALMLLLRFDTLALLTKTD